jgi:hypothetical protein
VNWDGFTKISNWIYHFFFGLNFCECLNSHTLKSLNKGMNARPV